MPDITTPEGRDVVEERIMRAMGAVGAVADDDWDRHVGWVLDIDDEPRCVPMGWLYTGDGMVAVKRWAAREQYIGIQSMVFPHTHEAMAVALLYQEGEIVDSRGPYDAPDEPTAVALALYHALEEVGG